MILVSKSLVPAALLRGARAAALALIALAWLASPGAQAQTGGTRVSDVLVSNTGQSDIAGISVGKYLYAQPFNTGDHGGGYHLAGVVLDFGAAPSAAAGTITVTVREDSSGNPSGNVLYTLINPAFSVGSNEFLAPLNAELNEDRTYWVVASHAGSFLDGPKWLRTPISDGLDAGSVVGWTIDATYKGATRSNPSLWLEGVPNDALQIAVKGSIQDLAAIRPGAPQTFEVKQGDTRMTLSWAEPADAGSLVAAITKYQYRFSAGATVAGGAIWNDVPDSIDLDASTADETQVVVTGLSNGTLYAFEVRAVSSAGNGVAAGPRNATPRHVLATNVGQAPFLGAVEATGHQKANEFTTGSNANGYTLQSIELDFDELPTNHAEATALTVSLWSATAAGEPNAALATLINPVNLLVADGSSVNATGETGVKGVKAFRAPANTGLSADTKYFVHVVCSQCFNVYINTTESTAVDAGHDANWSISVPLFSYYANRSPPVWSNTFHDRRLKIGINGTTGGGGAATTTNAPTAADNTVTIAQSARHTFTVGQFGFADADAGATLASVRIVGLPAAGTLALRGTKVVVGQIVPRADIVGGFLIFRPVPGAPGDPYATFTFKVNDGIVDSANANTMTINVPVPPEATAPGAPTGLTATAAGQSEIDLNWDAPDDDGGTNITGYRIEVSPDGAGASWADLVAHTTPDRNVIRTSYSHKGLDAATTRHYRVSAINAVGTSDPSNSDHATTEAATRQTEIVAADWALKPTDIAAGEQFRLMFVSSTKQDAFSADIADYNTFVSDLAAAGVTAMQNYAGDFTALVSTETVNARENTLTRDTDTDAPIYWVRSGPVAATNRAADDYADFYDGAWSTRNNGYNESGSFVGLTGGQFWTGTNPDGTTHATGFMSSRTKAIRWRVQSNGAILTSTYNLARTERIVALSPVFQVAAANNPPTAADNTVTIGADAAYTLKAADFGFADTDTGDTLASVRIETLPGAGELKLDDAAAVVDQVVTRADIDDNKLTFTPVAGATGDNYASFMFKVNDGTDFSAAANTITFNVIVLSCAAPGFAGDNRRDHWSGTVTMGVNGSGGVIFGYGFYEGSGIGSLTDPKGFSIGSNSYTIKSVNVETELGDVGEGALRFYLTSNNLTSAEAAALKLHVCDSAGFDFAGPDVETKDSDYSYSWAAAALDWSPPVATRTLYLSLPANQAATGEPTITGTAQVGQDLTADVSGIDDDDGLPGVFDYQWFRVDADGASDETEIAGEIASTYTLTTADVGKKVKVKVSFTDDLSGDEERTSGAYPTSATVTAANTAPTGADKTVTMGSDTTHTFTAVDFGFADTDTGDTLVSVIIESVPALGELTLDGTAVTADDVIPNADIDEGKLTFTPAAGASGDAYASFTFKVNDGTDFSAVANTITFNLRDLSCGMPDFAGDNRRDHWSGTVTVGGDDTIGYGFASGTGSLDPNVFSIGSNSYTIDLVTVGADAATRGALSLYLTSSNLTSAEAEALKLHVCDSAGFDFVGNDVDHQDADFSYVWAAAALDWSLPVATRTLYLSLPANNDATGVPTITGTARVGQELTADVSGIDDDDGLPSVFEYRWFRVDSDGSSNETEITGETASTYTLTTADVGKKVKVKVSFTDHLNGEEERTSAAYPASDTVAQMTTMVSIASGGDVAAEGDDATFTLTFSPAAPAGGLTVNVSVAEVRQRTLESGELPYDFVDAANEGMKTVDVAAGETSATLTVPTVDDELYEAEAGADNLLTATLATGTGYAVASGSDSAELTLMDGADRPVLAWKTDKVTVTEGVDDYAEVVLTLSHPLVEEARFNLLTVAASAQPDSDYTNPADNQNITFAPGATEATDRVGIVDGPLLEGTEIFTVQVFNDLAVPVTLASESTITVEILDADTMQLSPSAVSARVVEGGAIRIKIDTLPSGSCLSAAAFFVTVTPSGDTATLTNANAVEQRFPPCITTQTVSFATNEDTTVTANRALSFTLATRAGTDARITVTDDNVVAVAVIDDDRHATGAPTITGTAQVNQVLTASPGSIADGDGLAGAAYTYTWVRVDGSDEAPITGTTGTSYTVVAADQGNTLKVKASFTDDAGFDEERTSAPTATVIGLNSAPVFSQTAQARSIAENTAAGEDIGAAVTATDAGDTLTYTLGGTGMASFDIVAASGQIRTKSGITYDHEATPSYTVTVTATDTSNATAVATVTISITDEDEPPDAPAQPTVNAVSGSTTSLAVSWVAPANAGKPDIDSYDVQYRVTGAGAVWSDGGLDVNGTSTTITSLAADTPYEVQVRATNAEGDSGWSAPPGAGRTNAPANNVPTAANNTVTTVEDRAYTFTVDDFGFMDADAGAALASVTIVTPPASGKGTLALSGTAVSADEVVPAASIGNLAYTPPADANGTGYASFTFKVSDGTDVSAAAYTMTINVTPGNDPATGEPTISGIARVGRTLTVSTAGIMDVDGLPSTFSYQWQRLAGATTTSIAGANSRTYILQAADLGNKVAVGVSFTDDDGNAEMRTSGDYPTSGTVQADNTLVSNVGQSTTNAFPLTHSDFAQSFRTGTNLTGYTLSSIDLKLDSSDSTNTPTVKLYSGSANGTELATFNGPARLDASSVKNYAFTPSSTVILPRSTTYWVVAEGVVKWVLGGTGEDATPAMGWSIANNYEFRIANLTGSFTTDPAAEVLQIRVNGILGGIVLSNDATLSALALEDASDDSAIAISPVFASGTTSYTASVDNDVDEITITPTVNEGNATVEYLDSSDTAITDANPGKAGHQVSLAVGANTIKVKVTAQDTTTTRHYRVSANAVGTSDASGSDDATTEANTVTAQTDTTFISNSAQVGSISSITVRATAFTTGGNSGGYELSSVDIYVGAIVGAIATVSTITPRVEIFEDNADNPGTLHATLINPATVIDDSANTFNAPPNTTLSAGTSYWLVISNSAATDGQGFRISTSRDATADTGAAAGWSIGDARHKSDITNPWGSTSLRIIFTIKGTAAGAATNNAPTAADNTVTIGSDTAYTFEADDFGFADTDTGAALASVRIESVPLAGELKLDGTAAVVDQVVTSADIDDNKLTFTPAPGANGDAYASFTFKVNDGTDFSAGAYTITFNVRDLTCAAPGFGARRNHWSGTVTAAAVEDSGDIVAYGFDAASGTGSLAAEVFGIGSNSYTIEGAFVGTAAGAVEGRLTFDLAGSLTAAEAAALELHVCDSAGFGFAGADVEHDATSHYYSWDAAALDWSPPVTSRTLYLSLPANNPATGEPTISGTAQVEQDITADTSPITDADGLPASFTYQWVRVDADGTSNPLDISGANAATYTLTTADVGKKVKVKVSFTDDLSGDEELTSAAFPASATVLGANNAPTAADNTVTIGSDTAYTFEADDFGFDDTDAGDTLASVRIESVPLAGELKLDGTAAVVDQVVTSADIGDLTFTPVAGASGDNYASFMFKVNDGTDFSVSANTITFNVRDLSCAAPSFGTRRQLWTGIVTVEEITSGSDIVGYGFNLAQTGLDDTTFAIGRNSYTVDTAFVLSSTGVAGQLSFGVAGAIQNDNLTAGEVAALRLHVCDATVYDFSATSEFVGSSNTFKWAGSLDWSPPVATRTLYLSLPANQAAMGAPTITGTAQVGQDLTADVTGVTDADGLTGDLSTLIDNMYDLEGVQYSYQWLRVDADGTSNPADITGENAATYTLTDADEGKKVKVKVSFTDDLNGDEELTSAAYPASDTVAQMTTMVSIASGGDVTAEGDDATFTLTLSPAAPAGGLTVNVSVAEVRQRTLESGELPYDFVDAANEGMKTVDVTAGATSATLTVPTVNDALYEAEAGADNLLTATLATGTGYAVASGSDSAELTLMDGADRPVLAWKTDKVTVTEGVDENAEVVLTLSHPLVQEVRFLLVAIQGTASPSSDYTYPDDGEIITFAPGATEATSRVGILDRPLLEGTKILTVRVFDELAQPVTLAADSTITVEILDVDTMQLSPSAVSARVVEGDAIRIKIDTLPSGSCLFAETFFVTVTPSGDTATLTDAAAVEQLFGQCDTTRTVSFATNEDTDVTANRALSFTLATKAGTDARITVVTDNVVEVAVIDDDRHATGAPTITGTAQVDQVLTASPGSIADGDGLSGAAYTYTWVRVDGSDEAPITGTTGNSYTVVAADQGNTLKVKASFTDDAGFAEERTSAATATVIGLNSAPVFSQTAQARSIAENTASGENVGAVVEATDAGDTLTYTLGGTDMASFDIVGSSGQIRTISGVSYDFEAKDSYTVTVTASDSSNATAVATVTISITDVDEPPDAPATPTVNAVSGSTTSVAVSWAAPANAGKPAIDDYDVQYRVSGAGAWINGPRNVATTTATITGLTANTLYEAQVRATNDEGDSDWSDPPGAGRTNAPANNAPVFSSSNVSRSIAENTAAGQDIGAVVEATDADAGDTITYTLGGADMASFDFVEASGQIRTKSGVSYDHEDEPSYTVTVTATDTSNATAVATVTISITDVNEPPDAPAQPTVNAVSGSTTSLAVSWAAPANAGKPDIDSYDVQYRVTGSGAVWSDGGLDVAGTSTTITSLAADTLYEVQVRATNDEGDSGWSDPPGSGRTNAPANNAPVFSPSNVSRNIAENTAAGEDIGAAVTATDDAGDTITYTLGGADMASFDFVEASGQIRTKAGVTYDHEAKSSYTVTVTATDSSNATAEASVTISITDVNEPPDAPAQPTVTAVTGSATSLTVSWAAPANAGRPDIDSYDVQYRLSGATAWSDGPQGVTTTTANVTSLVADTLYEVQVRATNAEGDSGWSAPPVSGRTNAPPNNAPVFSSSNVSRSIAENTAAGQDIGAAVTATDAGDTLSYTLGGADMASFDFVAATGQIRTKSGISYDHEDEPSYTVTVTASDSSNATAVATVTISITDVDEPPDAPATPTVNAVSGSTTSVAVSWAAPANAGKPAIDDYDVQYRVSGAGAWINGPRNVATTTATITGLTANTLYEAQVRATNDEGDSDWSDPPGAGRTNAPANNAPVFSSSNVSRSIAENTAAGQDIGAVVEATDADAGDTITYTLGGADMASFDFVEASGQIRTKSGVSYDHEDEPSYTVTVTATDTSNATAVATVTISITDVNEPPDAPAQPTVNAVSGSTTSLAVSWAAPANAGKPDIDSYDVQYRVTGSGAVWSDGGLDVAGTSTTITSLAADTLYEVQVRATNDEGDSGWSDPPGAGRTNAPANTAPEFATDTTSRSFTETVGDAAVSTAGNVGAVVTATDADSDTLTYSLEGTDVAKFGIVSGSGQIQTKVGEKYDREAKASYSVTVKADDSNGGSDTIAVTITVDNEVEKPLAPAIPTVTATSGSTTSLDVIWAAPANTGRPAITGYKVEYREDTSGSWLTHAHTSTATTATIAGLTAATDYKVQVLAVNADGDGAFSGPGAGTTGTATNNAPVFADATASRSFTETVGDAAFTLQGNVGAVVTATDADSDTLTYSLEGTDVAKFGIVSGSGQIQTKVGEKYDREAKASYSVTVKADDSNGGSDTIAVTITVEDAEEKPLAPAMPTVTATSGSTTSLDVSWMAPANTGRPAITGYKVQYRAGMSGNWTSHAHTGTGTTATIASLTAATAYQVQVLAVNSDGDGAWSGAGTGTTGTNTAATGAPTITGTAQVGETLTASTTGIADANGLTSPTYTYQWIRANGTEDDIASANSSTYILVAADLGKTIKVKVSFEDDDSNAETLTSAATATVVAAPTAPMVTDADVTSTPASGDTYGTGEMIKFTVTFDQSVTVTGAPEFEFCLGTSATMSCDAGTTPPARRRAALSSGSGTTALVFGYTVVVGDVDDNGIWIGDQSRTIKLEGGTIQGTVGGLDAVLTHAEEGEKTGHKVNGAAANTAPTAANNTVTTAEDTAYTFTADDFGFMDADAGAALASVKIVTPPGLGTLALDGTAVLADAVVTKAQIDADMLIFTPARDAHGDPYTTFTFKVNDGTDDSASAYTMTIDVTDAPAPVCTAPSFGDRREIWSGTVTVEEFSFMGSVTGYGFQSSTGISSLLPSAEFSIGSNTYTIAGIAVAITEYLNFNVNPGTNLTATERAALRLHVCDEDLDFSVAENSVGDPIYGWAGTLDWSDPVDTRTVYLSLPANNVATGEPAITGTAQVGQELTADASPIMDTDGLTDVDFTYQWLRVDADGTSNEEDISGEIAATYTLTDADEGKKVKVKVSFTDELSGVEMRTSAAYPSSGTVMASTDDDVIPVLSTATVDGASLVLTYGEALDPGSVPVAGDFAVSVAGLTAVVSNVGVLGRAVTLTLANAVVFGQTVTVSYTVGTNPIQDLGGNDAVALSSEAVDNNTISAPGAPENLGATPGDGRVTLAWAAPASTGGAAISKYQYRARQTGTTAWTPDWTDVPDGSDPGNSAADETRVTVSGLTNGTQYRFEVRAVNRIGGGTAASRNETPVAAPARVPGQPRSLLATTGDGQVTLAWAAPASTGGAAISKYQYRAKETGASVWTPDWMDVPDGSDPGSSAADETRVTVSGLTNGTQYRFEVRAVNSIGEGTAASRNETPVATPARVPGQPRSLLAASGDGQVTLTWEAPQNDGGADIVRYDYRHAQGTSVPASEPWLSAGLNLRQTVAGLDNDRQYTFEVRAANSAGESDPASIQATPAANATAPSAPRFLKAVTSDRQVGLTWIAPVRDGGSSISKYEYRHASGASVPDDTPWSSGTSYRLQAGFGSLINGQRYTFQVRAVAAVAGPAASVTATPSANPVRCEPGAVSGLTATAEAYADDHRRRQYGRVTLTWSPPAGDDNSVLERFEYRYAEEDSALADERWRHGPSDRLSETVKRLKLDTVYVFEVRAVNLEGPGPAVRTTVLTPAAAVGTGLISLHATQSDDVAEGGALTFEVRRSNELNSDELNSDTFVLVAVTDSAFPGGNRLLGEDGLGMRVLEFQSGASSARGTVRVAFDGARPSSRTVTVSLQSVEVPYYYGTPTTLSIAVTDRDAGLSVRDAQVSEGPGVTLEFAVTLDRARDQDVTVKYATSDGTATAGDDYTHTAGTLVFAAGETEKTVSVPVLDDAFDEGAETLILTLSNAMGAVITDASATGTISNSDPLPKGWLARFGRTSATQVLGLLDARFDEARAPASQLTLGGRPIKLSGPGSNPQGRADPSGGPAAPLTPGGDSRGTADVGIGPAATHADRTAVPHSAGGPAAMHADPFDALASRYTLDDAARGMADLHNDPVAMHADPSAAPASAGGAVGAGGEATLLERLAWRLLTRGGWSVDRRQFLSGSSFDLSLSALGRETDGAAIETARVRETPGHWSLWGRGALTRFAGRDTGVSLDGDVLTGLLGLDYSRGRWLAGVGLAYNDGDGAYRAPGSGTAGKLDSTLVSVHPYLHYALTDRLSAWGTLGYGGGTLSLRPARAGDAGDGLKSVPGESGAFGESDPIETGIGMRMGALGLRGTVFANATTELALKSDLMWVRTASSETAGLAAVDGADASRVRLLLTGRHRHMLATGAALTPNVELGLRYDDGAAETGAGVELGGGLRYADAVRGLTVEATARSLLAHEDGGYEEWGLSGSLQLDPGRLGRGLSLRLASGWGLTDSGTDTLWQQQTASGLTRGAGQTSRGRVKVEWAYGLDVPRTHGLLTPYGSVEMAGGGGRTLALGWRFELGQSLSLSLTGERREALRVTPEHALMLQTTLPW